MNSDGSSLGRCPECGERIPPAWLLVEYEREDSTEGVWAECPACEGVVAPEQSQS
jgi:phage terminase large subunit GpA-like protein